MVHRRHQSLEVGVIRSLCALALAQFVVAGTAMGEAASAVGNGGFETLGEAGAPAGWTRTRLAGKGSLTVTDGDARFGRRAVRISGEGQDFRGWYGSEAVPVERQAVYELRARAEITSHFGGSAAWPDARREEGAYP